MLKNIKKKLVSIGIEAVLFCTLFFILNAVLDYMDNPYDRYHAPGTSMTAHQIRIDEDYTVDSMSKFYSVLWYNDHKGTVVEYTDSLDSVNWDEQYIIAGCRVDQLSSSSDRYYLIVDRSIRDAFRYDTFDAFEEAMQEKNIQLKLKKKKEFDWYLS